MKYVPQNIKFSLLLAVLSPILYLFMYRITVLVSIEVISNLYVYAFFTFLAVAPLSHVIRSERHEKLQFYFDSFTLSVYLIGFFLMLSSLLLLYYAMFALLLLLMWKTYGKNPSYLAKAAVYSAAYVSLLTIASIMRFGVYNPPFVSHSFGSTLDIRHVIVFSITDDASPKGIPFYFSGGVVVQGISTVLTLSFQSIFIYGIITALLTENYFLIVKYVRDRGKGIVKGTAAAASTALSCQCETISAALPTVSLLFVSFISAILLLEGFSVLLFTYIFISRFLMKGKNFPSGFLASRRRGIYAISIIFLLVVPVLITLGIYFGLLGSLLFIMGSSISMFAEGIAIVYIARSFLGEPRIGRALFISMIVASSILMFIWYYPAYLQDVATIPLYFIIMGITSLSAGIMASSVYYSTSQWGKRLFIEYTAMMFSMAAIIIFYISVVYSISIWPYFGLQQQEIFSILLIAVSLPVTVFNTNFALRYYGTAPA